MARNKKKAVEQEMTAPTSAQIIHTLRKFQAAQHTNTLFNWIQTQTSTFDEEIRTDINSLRTRSRDMSINNSFVRRLLKVARYKVVGDGFDVRFNVRNPRGGTDDLANSILNEKFREFSKSVTTDGLSLKRLCKLVVECLYRDGEFLGVDVIDRQVNDYGYAIQVYPSEYLDSEAHRERLDNGNKVSAGIEYNAYNRPVKYYFLKDLRSKGNDARHFQVSSDRVLHVFDRERADQGRGYPWIAASLEDLKHISEYRKSESIAARLASCKSVFLTRSEDATLDLDDVGDNPAYAIQDLNSGGIDVLPPGYGVEVVDFNNPNQNFSEFTRQILRGVTASWGVTYNTIAMDIEGVNYSSLRGGDTMERETWREIQDIVIDDIINRVVENWLKESIKHGKLGKLSGDFARYNNFEVVPRGYVYLDPAKEAAANKSDIENTLKSRSEILRSSSRRKFEDVVREIAEEERIMREYGLLADPVIDEVEVEGEDENDSEDE